MKRKAQNLRIEMLLMFSLRCLNDLIIEMTKEINPVGRQGSAVLFIANLIFARLNKGAGSKLWPF